MKQERTNIFTTQSELPDSVAMARLLAYVLVLRAGGKLRISAAELERVAGSALVMNIDGDDTGVVFSVVPMQAASGGEA